MEKTIVVHNNNGVVTSKMTKDDPDYNIYKRGPLPSLQKAGWTIKSHIQLDAANWLVTLTKA